MSPIVRSLILAAALAGATSASAAPYVSGGVGEDSLATLQQAYGNYNTHLTFAERGSGAYLAGVAVTIRDTQQQTVLATTSEGPLLYARLPAGKYTVSASSQGEVLTTTLTIPPRGHREHVFRFAPGRY
ncbi:hypothetical protein [Chitinilyticum litopenaei]|uniref:hypothetical protein n=1 Tax=Chitinilyticum litopenaei TaxID=1121276 RepID=UPI000404267F|nr:hypothetical protein [Chitinilyticum litopenaei]